MADDDSLAGIDAIAVALVDRARPATFRLARGQQDLETAQRLRALAVIDRGWADAEELTDGREVDSHDARATHILAMLDGDAIGTCRLIYPEESMQPAAVEVGRIVMHAPVARAQRSVMAGLIGAAWLELRAHGHTRITGTVSAPMLRLFRRLGFLVTVVGPEVHTFGEARYPILFEPTAEAASAAGAAASAARPSP